jgi:glycerol kinase
MAGLATGFWDSKEELAEKWKLERRYDPQMGEEEREQLHRRWLNAVERAKGWDRERTEAEAAEA